MTDIEQRKKAARLTIANVLAGTGTIIGAEVMDTLWELTEPAPSEWQKCPDCKNGMLTNCSETATVKK